MNLVLLCSNDREFFFLKFSSAVKERTIIVIESREYKHLDTVQSDFRKIGVRGLPHQF